MFGGPSLAARLANIQHVSGIIISRPVICGGNFIAGKVLQRSMTSLWAVVTYPRPQCDSDVVWSLGGKGCMCVGGNRLTCGAGCRAVHT